RTSPTYRARRRDRASAPPSAGEAPGEGAGGKRRLEEERVVVGPAPHVLERQAGTGLAPAAGVDLLAPGEPVRRLSARRPGDNGLRRGELDDRARGAGDAAMAPPVVAARGPSG